MNPLTRQYHTPRSLLVAFWICVLFCLITIIATIIPQFQALVDLWFLYPLMLSLIIGTTYHALFTLGTFHGLLLLGLGAIIGFIAEAVSLRTGTVFGSLYVYRDTPAMLLGVPIEIIFFWGVFIYFGYSLTNSFLTWSGFEKPNKMNGMFIQLVWLILLDGVFVTAIDVIMDPIKVAAGDWTWFEQGAYFGIPFGNFVGWFFVTIVVTGVFRTFEFHNPTPTFVHHHIVLIPVIFYLLTACGLISVSLASHMNDLALIACFVLLLPSLINLALYSFWRTNHSEKTITNGPQ